MNIEETKSYQQELLSLLETLCRIPAPSGQEDHRADFISTWLSEECGISAEIDAAKNVRVCFHSELPDPVTVFMAHTDTVFPDTDPITVTCTGERIAAPGVGDDTACVAIMMLYIKYHQERLQASKSPLLFVFNSCEEGLGNLKGCRYILKDYDGRIKELISFDGGVDGICNHAVGSIRYEISIRTQGGHSYNDFGNRNSIQAMSDLICRLYQMPLPENGRNTFNAGTINGGTSVNTIAQSCSCLFEYRSDTRENLHTMDQYFHRTIAELCEAFPEINLSLTLMGERPCMGDVDPVRMLELTDRAKNCLSEVFGTIPACGAGSTDCNIPLSLGIPAICFGGLIGDGVHTREEYVSIPLLLKEAQAIIRFIHRSI